MAELTGPNSRIVVAKFEGAAVQRGRVVVSDFVKVLHGLQQTLILVGQELMGRTPTRGPIPQSYTAQLSLELVSTEPGSFLATLSLPERLPDQLVDIGEDALEKVIDGIDLEVHGGESNPFLSDRARLVVRDTILRAVGPETSLTLEGGKHHRAVHISQSAVENIMKTPTPALPRGKTRLVGRLLEVDFKDRTAEVYDAAGVMTRIRFSDDMANRVKAAARMQVMVEGGAEVDDRGRTRGFELDDLAVVDITEEFWNNPSLDSLVQQRGGRPITSLSDFAGSSFDASETDDLLSELRSLGF